MKHTPELDDDKEAPAKEEENAPEGVGGGVLSARARVFPPSSTVDLVSCASPRCRFTLADPDRSASVKCCVSGSVCVSRRTRMKSARTCCATMSSGNFATNRAHARSSRYNGTSLYIALVG